MIGAVTPGFCSSQASATAASGAPRAVATDVFGASLFKHTEANDSTVHAALVQVATARGAPLAAGALGLLGVAAAFNRQRARLAGPQAAQPAQAR